MASGTEELNLILTNLNSKIRLSAALAGRGLGDWQNPVKKPDLGFISRELCFLKEQPKVRLGLSGFFV